MPRLSSDEAHATAKLGKFTDAISEAVTRESAVEGTLSLRPAAQRTGSAVQDTAERGAIEEKALEGTPEIVFWFGRLDLLPRLKVCVRVKASVCQFLPFGREDDPPERRDKFIEICKGDLVDEVVFEHSDGNGRAPGEWFDEKPRPELLGPQDLRDIRSKPPLAPWVS